VSASEFVIDASAALAWLLPSQSTAASVAFIETRGGESFIAPHIFCWEVGNVLLSLYRRRGLLSGAHAEALLRLDALEIDLQPALSGSAIRELDHVARDIGLSLFDAAYLALALEHRCALVSRGERLLSVAKAEDIECIDLCGPI